MSRNPHFHNLILSDSFKCLKTFDSPEKLQVLENDLINNGCQEPILTWHNKIIDGYKRYSICKKTGIACRTKSTNFQYEEEAIAWVCRQELKKPFLPDGHRKYLIGKLYNAQKVAYSKLYPMPADAATFTSKRPPIEYTTASKNYTAQVLSHEYGLGFSTIYKYTVFANGIDVLRKKDLEITKMILNDKVQVSLNAVTELSKLSVADLDKMRACFLDDSTFRIQLNDIERTLNMRCYVPKTLPKLAEPEIKQVPKYDPDAEITSLTLTIPSWISYIQRTCNNATFELISDNAKEKLALQLSELYNAVYTIQNALEVK